MPTLPISYIYFSWWQLQFTTQHSKYKRRYVEGYNSDRFAASKRDFKILVWKRFPVPEGGCDYKAHAGEDAGMSECSAHSGCGAKLCRAGGRLHRPHMEPTFCANRTKQWHIQQAEQGNPAKQGN